MEMKIAERLNIYLSNWSTCLNEQKFENEQFSLNIIREISDSTWYIQTKATEMIRNAHISWSSFYSAHQFRIANDIPFQPFSFSRS